VRALQLLHGLGITTHLVMSESAGVTLAYETAFKPADLKAIAFEVSSR
jgi:3-polyprenyl-4-hydroxybenzoate decarboxylase